MTEFHKTSVLVVGAGPAGLAAAAAAARSGRRVLLVDQNPDPGGQIWRSSSGQLHPDARAWLKTLEDLGVDRSFQTAVMEAPDPGRLVAERAGELLCLDYEHLILASGCRERFLPFPGWTLPGVFGAGGLQVLVKGGLEVAGKKIVVAGTGPLLLAVGAFLTTKGARVRMVAEQARFSRVASFAGNLVRAPSRLIQGIKLRYRLGRSARYLTGCWPVSAQGEESLQRVQLRKDGENWVEECDFLACAFGLVPNTELGALLGCPLEDGGVRVNDFQQTDRPGVYAAGEITGIGGVELAVVEGKIAGLMAADQQERAGRLLGQKVRLQRIARSLEQTFRLRDELKELPEAGTIICRCEDVVSKQIRVYSDWRSAKLQTRCGMGPCQGRICGPAAEFLFGWRVQDARPPLFPVVGSWLAKTREQAK